MPAARRVRTHTALHILKGAVESVLGAKWTAGVYSDEAGGRLTVSFARKPTREELNRIEEEANSKIEENVEIEELEMGRSEAESRWGDAIYDLFPIPPRIKRLKILHIEAWNVNACKEKHCASTVEIGRMRIDKARFRQAKRLLEISFRLEETEQ